MDPIANRLEQLQLARDLLRRLDIDDFEGLTGAQVSDALHDALRLAELVVALASWDRFPSAVPDRRGGLNA